MKKLFTAILVSSALAGPAYAQNAYNASQPEGSMTPLTGFYVGALGGYGWGDADSDYGADPDVNGKEYGVFAGYKMDALLDKTINRTGLGLNGALEVQYVWSDADDTQGGVNYEKNNEFGVSFRPGLSVLDSVSPFGLNPYGIIGYRHTQFEASAPGVDVDDSFDGFELGLGTEVLAYQDFGVRLDYSHTWYEENDGFDPSEDNLRLGVAYHF